MVLNSDLDGRLHLLGRQSGTVPRLQVGQFVLNVQAAVVGRARLTVVEEVPISCGLAGLAFKLPTLGCGEWLDAVELLCIIAIGALLPQELHGKIPR